MLMSLGISLALICALQLAVGHEPIRYRDLVVDPQTKAHRRWQDDLAAAVPG